jgi:hypothetical protein
MSLKGICFKAGRYARRNDPHRREYYSNYPRRPGPTQTPASGQEVSPVGGCGVAIFMLGGLFALACPPLGVIFILVGGLVASGSAVASNRRYQSGTSAPPLPTVPAAVQPDELIRIKLPPRPGKPVQPESAWYKPNRVFDQSPPAPVQSVETEYLECSCGCCGADLDFLAEWAGMTVTCPACQRQIVLPRADPTNEI